MNYQNTAQVPNAVFDLLPILTPAELKTLLVIIRQTYGWKNPRTGHRKKRDRISHSQFMKKTGLSRRVISACLAKLTSKDLIETTDTKGNILANRKGRTYIFYAFKPAQMTTRTCADDDTQPVQKGAYNKTNSTKLTLTKGQSVVPVEILLKHRMTILSQTRTRNSAQQQS